VGGARSRIKARCAEEDFPSEEAIIDLRSLLNKTMRSLVEEPRHLASQVVVDLLKEVDTDNVELRLQEDIDTSVELLLPAQDVSATHLSSGIGGAIGGVIGGALLGPLGAVPLGVFGGWIGSLLAPKPTGRELENRMLTTLGDLERRAIPVVHGASSQIALALREQILAAHYMDLGLERQRLADGELQLREADGQRLVRYNEVNQRSKQLERLMQSLGTVTL